MSTIKMFNGVNPPLLKQGEWASNGIYAYLGLENKQNKIFQSVFDVDLDQTIAGFLYHADKRCFYIPKNTPLSKVQLLLDELPRSLKLKTNDIKTDSGVVIYSDKEIKFLFDTIVDIDSGNNFIDDLEYNLTIRDFSYKIRFATYASQTCPDPDQGGMPGPGQPLEPPTIECVQPKFVLDKEILIFNSQVEFDNIHFDMVGQGQNASNMLRVLNSNLSITNSFLQQAIGSVSYLNVIENSNVSLENNTYTNKANIAQEITYLISKIGTGSNVRVKGGQKTDLGFKSTYLANNISGNLYVVDPNLVLDNTENRKLAQSLKPSYSNAGGMTILGGLSLDSKDQESIKTLSEGFFNAGISSVEVDTQNGKLILRYNNDQDELSFSSDPSSPV